MLGSMSVIARIVLAAAIACLASTSAFAICGDGTPDVGEQCDDGNTQAGDCCASDCTFEPSFYSCTHDQVGACFEHLSGQCDGQGGCRPGSYCAGDPFEGLDFYGAANVKLQDGPGTENDRLRWLSHGGYTHYQSGDEPPPGDPTVDTAWTICLYRRDMDGNLLVTNEYMLPAGPDWKKTRTGFQYRKTSPAGGGFGYLRAQNYPRVLLRGAAAELPGPVSATQYFDSVAFGIFNSAGVCIAASWPTSGKRVVNTPERFKFRTRVFLD
jgi:cysteine-rich repeat protein